MAIGAVTVSVSCGETIDLATTTTTSVVDTTIAVAPDAPSVDEVLAADPETAPLNELIDALVVYFQGLDDDAAVGDRRQLDAILSLWAVLESRLIAERPGLHHGFTQAVDLATLAVERRRPADATKAQRIVLEMRASAVG